MIRKFFLAACALASIQSCDNTSRASRESETARISQPRHRYGKPSAPVDVIPQSIDIVDVGVQTPIEIALLPRLSADEATVEITASDGLRLSNVPSPMTFAALKPPAVYHIALEVTAMRSGLHHLGVLVKLRDGQTTQTKAVSIRIAVGKIAPDNSQTPTPSNKKAIEELRANESVSK